VKLFAKLVAKCFAVLAKHFTASQKNFVFYYFTVRRNVLLVSREKGWVTGETGSHLACLPLFEK
jgi:hypothetical protein